VITASGGLKLCYLIDALTFAGALYGVFRLPPMRPEGNGSQRNLGAVIEGLRFIVDNRALRGAMLADLSATVLAMPIALFRLRVPGRGQHRVVLSGPAGSLSAYQGPGGALPLPPGRPVSIQAQRQGRRAHRHLVLAQLQEPALQPPVARGPTHPASPIATRSDAPLSNADQNADSTSIGRCR